MVVQFDWRWFNWLLPTLCLWAWGGAVIVLVSSDAGDATLFNRVFGVNPPADTSMLHAGRRSATRDAKPRMPYYGGRLFTVNSRFHPLIEKVSATHNVDDALVKAMVQAESAFDSDALSTQGAQGLMQVLPTTAARYSIENLFDPQQNLHAGVRHLKRLLRMFKGDVALALAAYNAGENAVKRFDGIPPYEETLAYVGKVLGLWKLYARQLPLYPPTTLLSQSQVGSSG